MSADGIIAKPVQNPLCPKCGAALPEAEPLTEVVCPACGETVMAPGMLAGKYRLTRRIGAGGMGAVYEALDEGLERKVAVKVILKEKAAEDPDFLTNFKKEAVAASRFQDAHIVSIYDSGEEAGQPYLVMELVEPDSLDRMMKSGPVMPGTVLNVGSQIAQGLKAAADVGMVHGDVKPENILINDKREAKLADFGIAALMGAHAAANNEVWGTPYYIAPETLRKQKVDFRADIYSLGGTLYHAIAGVPPFEGADAVEVMKGRLMGPARPLRQLAPGCPEGIEKIIMRMLEAEPARRYPNYSALLNDMDKELRAVKSQIGGGKRIVLKGATTPSRPMPVVTNPNAPLVPEAEEKPGMSLGLLIGLGAGLVLFIVGVIITFVLLLGGKDEDKPSKSTDGAAQSAPAVPVDPAAEQRAADLEALVALSEGAVKRAGDLTKGAKDTEAAIKRLADELRKVTLPENESWLEPAEGEAPNEVYAALQALYGRQKAIAAAADQAEAARKAIDGERAKAEAPEATPEAVAAALQAAQKADKDCAAAVKPALADLKAFQAIEKTWQPLLAQATSAHQAALEAQAKAEEATRQEEARQAEEARRREAIAREVESVTVAENRITVTRPLDRFRPEDALKAFERACNTDKLTSQEAKDAAQTVKDRIGALKDFQDWIVEQAAAGTLSAYGISAADAKGVTIHGTTLTWEDFATKNAGQMAAGRLIHGSLADEAGARAAGLDRPSERAEKALGAYLFLNRYCGDLLGRSAFLRNTSEALRAAVLAVPIEAKKLDRIEPSAAAMEGEGEAEEAETAE